MDQGLYRFCPHGQPGDRLWVRETWSCIRWSKDRDTGHVDDLDYCDDLEAVKEQLSQFKDETGSKTIIIPRQPNPCIVYNADEGWDTYVEDRGFPWKPSIHMPRWASRIDLPIIRVRVERVLDISQSDARAEGYETSLDFLAGKWATSVFEKYGEDPWVWVLEFKRIE